LHSVIWLQWRAPLPASKTGLGLSRSYDNGRFRNKSFNVPKPVVNCAPSRSIGSNNNSGSSKFQPSDARPNNSGSRRKSLPNSARQRLNILTSSKYRLRGSKSGTE
jgi:hypothetical protein